MNQNHANPSIGCTVAECAYHHTQKDACTLGSIQVGKSSSSASSCDCTECDSFELKKPGR